MIPDLFGSSAPPAVRQPIFEIAFGAGGGSGPTDLLSSAASAIGFGSGGAVDPWLRSVASLSVEIGLAPEVDVVDIELAADSQAPPVALGDEGTIALGYRDAGATTVYTGRIESVLRSGRGALRITVANGTAALAALRLEQSYENQSAGDVVSDLASRVGITPGNIATGADLAFVVLDGGRGAWEHIARLARVSGNLATITADDELDFAPPDDGEAVQTFTWGVDVLSVERRDTAALFDAVTMSGEGAAGSEGKDAWNWLVKQPSPVTGAAGQGSQSRAFADRALRTADSVRGAAQALAEAAARVASVGTLLVPGAPDVRPGLRVGIAGVPDGALNGEFLVTRVRHTFAKRSGFRTQISFAGSGGGSGAGSLLGGLL